MKTNETITTILTRRSVCAFGEPSIERDDLEALLLTPADYEVHGSVAFGYAAQSGRENARKSQVVWSD
ncbi:MAG: hypothetical protein RR862_00665 [Eggerthellaceae bacterium]